LKKLNGWNDVLTSCVWGRFHNGNFTSDQFILEIVRKDLDSITWIKKAFSQQNVMMVAWVWLIPKAVMYKLLELMKSKLRCELQTFEQKTLLSLYFNKP
jgi:hypothetical protein